MNKLDLEDGYLKIVNGLAEAFCRLKLSATQWRVLWAIIRLTYGWRSKSAEVSVRGLVKLTGLHRREVSKAKAGLKEKGLIVVYEPSFGRRPERIGLNKYHESWGSRVVYIADAGIPPVESGISPTRTDGSEEISSRGKRISRVGKKGPLESGKSPTLLSDQRQKDRKTGNSGSPPRKKPKAKAEPGPRPPFDPDGVSKIMRQFAKDHPECVEASARREVAERNRLRANRKQWATGRGPHTRGGKR